MPPCFFALRIALSKAGLQSLVPSPLAPNAVTLTAFFSGRFAPVMFFTISAYGDSDGFVSPATRPHTDRTSSSVRLLISFILYSEYFFRNKDKQSFPTFSSRSCSSLRFSLVLRLPEEDFSLLKFCTCPILFLLLHPQSRERPVPPLSTSLASVAHR